MAGITTISRLPPARRRGQIFSISTPKGTYVYDVAIMCSREVRTATHSSRDEPVLPEPLARESQTAE